MKSKKILLIPILIILVFFTIKFRKSQNINKKVEEEKIIVHAMGGIGDEPMLLNALEGFEEHYKNGCRYFEVDFQRTSDGKLACVHDWETWAKLCGISSEDDIPIVPTDEQFKSIKIRDKFTPLDIDDIANIIKDHEDIYIVTDSKRSDVNLFMEDIAQINSAMEKTQSGLSKRVIVQAYNVECLKIMEDFPDFDKIIFTTYQSGLNEDGIIDVIKKYGDDLFALTIYKKTVNDKIIEAAKAEECPVYVHTVNDIDEAEHFFNMGVFGVYSDTLLPEDLI
jgi:glycerophosphoryl diester phosphodiesterase